MPRFRPPQLAVLSTTPPSGPEWLHEIKFDGYRVLAAMAGGSAKLYTRSGLDWTEKFRGVAEAVAQLPARGALIDGEVVVLRRKRPHRFWAAAARARRRRRNTQILRLRSSGARWRGSLRPSADRAQAKAGGVAERGSRCHPLQRPYNRRRARNPGADLPNGARRHRVESGPRSPISRGARRGGSS